MGTLRVLPLLAALLLLGVSLAPLAAAAYPDPDKAPRYYDSACISTYDRRFVYDYVGVMALDHGEGIEGAACEVYEKTHAHFALVAVHDTGGEILENYALHLFETWGIGQKDVNDGLLLLYVEDYQLSGKSSAVRVEVGYGLEGVVNAKVSNDAIRLMQDAKARALDAGRPDQEARSFALATGSAYLLTTLDEEYVDGSFPRPTGGAADEVPLGFWVFVFIAVIVLVAVLQASAPRRRRGWGYYPGSPSWGSGLGGAFGGGSFGGGGFGGGRSGGGGGSGGF